MLIIIVITYCLFSFVILLAEKSQPNLKYFQVKIIVSNVVYSLKFPP